jgi:hypothetical protein
MHFFFASYGFVMNENLSRGLQSNIRYIVTLWLAGFVPHYSFTMKLLCLNVPREVCLFYGKDSSVMIYPFSYHFGVATPSTSGHCNNIDLIVLLLLS